MLNLKCLNPSVMHYNYQWLIFCCSMLVSVLIGYEETASLLTESVNSCCFEVSSKKVVEETTTILERRLVGIDFENYGSRLVRGM